MALAGGAIAGIVIGLILALLLLIGLVCYVIKSNDSEDGTCYKLLDKYTGRSKVGDQRLEMVANYPEVTTTFIRTPVPGQQFTARELKNSDGSEFVIPSRELLLGEEDELKPSMYSAIDPETIDPRKYSPGYEAEGGAALPKSEKRPPQVIFSVEYDQEFSILKICVIEARHLRPGPHTGTCDPYCTVAVTPGDTEKRSKVQKKTSDPIFDESFSFEVPKNELAEKTIEIKFFDFDQYSRHECTGTVTQKLKEIDLKEGKVDLWRKIVLSRAYTEEPEEFGDILLRLGYLPSAEKLTVVLLKARNLKNFASEESKQPDPYIRVAILHDGNLLKKKKTSTKRKSSNPTYNQAINFAVPLDVLPQVEIQFSVVHESGVKIHRTSRKEAIGYLEIGPHSTGDEYDHWMDLMSNKPQARWHRLQRPPESANESSLMDERPSTSKQ